MSTYYYFIFFWHDQDWPPPPMQGPLPDGLIGDEI